MLRLLCPCALGSVALLVLTGSLGTCRGQAHILMRSLHPSWHVISTLVAAPSRVPSRLQTTPDCPLSVPVVSLELALPDLGLHSLYAIPATCLPLIRVYL